jgi:hypothetical protein
LRQEGPLCLNRGSPFEKEQALLCLLAQEDAGYQRKAARTALPLVELKLHKGNTLFFRLIGLPKQPVVESPDPLSLNQELEMLVHLKPVICSQ